MKNIARKVAAVVAAAPAALAALPALAASTRLPLPSGVQGIPTKGTLEDSAVQIINFGLGFVGLVAVGFLIYGGYMYIISRGDSKEIETAKTVITYAIIGIISAY